MRADLHDWHTLLLHKMLVTENISIEELPSINNSQFSLWIRHKASVFFKGHEEINALNDEMHLIDEKLKKVVGYKNKKYNKKLKTAIEEINNHVKQMSWLLASLTEHAHSQDSAKDALTKLYNRRYLDIILQKETQLAINNNQSYLVLMIDIDNFKMINDTYGHQIGDKVIAFSANTLYESVRTSDYVFRYGGDEFLILLVDTSLERAKELASRLINDISTMELKTNDGIKVEVTVSIGIAMHDGSLDYLNIISKADAALYDAKQKGRNGYSVAR